MAVIELRREIEDTKERNVEKGNGMKRSLEMVFLSSVSSIYTFFKSSHDAMISLQTLDKRLI